MKKLEQAPSWKEHLLKTVTFNLFGQQTEVLNKIESEYLYWDKVKQLAKPEKLEPELLWAAVKFKRNYSATFLRFCDQGFHFNITDNILEQLHHFDIQIGGQLSSSSTISDHQKSQLLITSLMEEAIASSQIEGAVTTRKKAKKMLQSQQKPKNTSDQMIINNYRIIQRIVKDQKMTVERLLELHTLITSNTMEDKAEEGRLRTDAATNVVDMTDGEITHQPPA